MRWSLPAFLVIAAATGESFAGGGGPACAGDLTGDQLVDVADLTQVILGWGPCPGDCPPCPGDTQGDCEVDVEDLVDVLTGWGECPAAPGFFINDVDGFNAAIVAAGLHLDFDWSFEPDTIEAAAKVVIADGLNIETHASLAPGVWDNGIIDLWPEEVRSVSFAANVEPGGPLVERGALGLFYRTPDGELLTSTLTANFFADAFDVVLNEPNSGGHRAVGLHLIKNPSFVLPPPVWHVTVFDHFDVELGSVVVNGPPAGQSLFLGVTLNVTIGRIDIWDARGGAEGLESIAAFSP